MDKHIVYKTKGTCSRQIEITLSEDGTVVDAVFVGGCSGNTQGISSLVRGMKAEEVVKRLSGIKCGFKPTSCPDQLATALSETLK
ncbi:MAG: TIGR03905 family TSCPD domain-containing protein [Clostridia bacterium]|nr:TIGR03905 family TSCPD domain-containing protein [Clostridia bacterium]